ncbi:hypothetical protein [Mycobacterium colombiense]|uniref:hypothetical protein n=1 Tax=Mycobacterium colombiense TaxID=339268 RepID=UPI0012DAF985|nr:hypothetical protein [Mycobacterium colombiense]
MVTGTTLHEIFEHGLVAKQHETQRISTDGPGRAIQTAGRAGTPGAVLPWVVGV